MGVDLFRLGIGFVLLALMFPLADLVGEYVGYETSAVTVVLWLLGVVLVFASAFVPGSGRGVGERSR